MAQKDFDETQLAADALAIGGPDGLASEPFTYAGVTYYGVFNQINSSAIMEATGFVNEAFITLCFPRVSLTAGMPVNSLLYRVFDSTTYRVINPNTDEQWHEYTLRKPVNGQ